MTVSLLADRGIDIIDLARIQEFTIITQDLDFSSIIASRDHTRPSLVSIRLRDNRPEHVATVLAKVLLATEADLEAGAMVTIEDSAIRIRFLPVS